MKRLVLVCVALATFCVVALTGLSNFYRTTDPQRALSLNPLNITASMDLLISAINAREGASPVQELGAVAQNAIQYTPIHAPARGLLGEILHRQGDQNAANAVFEVALSLSKTEPTALQRTLATAVRGGDNASAMAKLDILFRRWPARFASFAPAIPYLLRQPDGYQVALAVLREDPPWRPHFLRYLNGDPGTVDLAYRLQLDLNSNTKDTRPRELGGTLSALLRNGKYDFAHRLFLLTLNEADRSNNGYLFNSSFELEPSGRPFDWTLRSQPGVRVSRDTRDTSNGEDSTLTVQFLGKPVKRIGVDQHLYLPPGKYELAVDLDVANLKTPKGLFLNIVCIDPRRTVSRLDIPTGSYRDKILTTEFTLADSTCKMLRLGMGTDLIAESFRYRYSGTLSIRDISVRKTAS
ncbi:MAG: hypothetical protein GY789_16115 [Hyphomicrobiales bacterium]|nr:hypothetical protein [Hyphomicrobiales bacterium]MCP5002100.1 hypothetical protein [Hyphomicrobiales bacterium]